jgi:hypothetical protein
MRLSLYDALFAALVNLYGQQARRTISRVTLAGGLASAVFWPLGDGLLQVMSWQEALRVYALFGLLSAMLIRTLPRQRLTVTTKVTAPPLNNERRNGWLYAAFIALITFVSNGTSTHLPEFIAHFGLPVAIGMLWGFGQTGARSLEVLAGARLTPFKLTLFTALAMPLCFLLGISSALFVWCAAGFVLGYGAINGLVTIVKATLPLELFSAESYARRTGDAAYSWPADGGGLTVCLCVAEQNAGDRRNNVGINGADAGDCRAGDSDCAPSRQANCIALYPAHHADKRVQNTASGKYLRYIKMVFFPCRHS